MWTGEIVESFNQTVQDATPCKPDTGDKGSVITPLPLIFGIEYYWCSFGLECTQKLQCLVDYS